MLIVTMALMTAWGCDRNGLRDPDETDATLRDTDGDGIDDGLEDANGDGRTNFDETSPIDSNRDEDGLLDGEEDLNRNGQVISAKQIREKKTAMVMALMMQKIGIR